MDFILRISIKSVRKLLLPTPSKTWLDERLQKKLQIDENNREDPEFVNHRTGSKKYTRDWSHSCLWKAKVERILHQELKSLELVQGPSLLPVCLCKPGAGNSDSRPRQNSCHIHTSGQTVISLILQLARLKHKQYNISNQNPAATSCLNWGGMGAGGLPVRRPASRSGLDAQGNTF